MAEAVEAFLGAFVGGFEVVGDLVKGLADSRVVCAHHVGRFLGSMYSRWKVDGREPSGLYG